MVETKSYDTYAEVPAGHNLVNSSPAQLDHYGIPQRPDATNEAQLFEFWKKLVSPPFSARLPAFTRMHSPPRVMLRELKPGGTHEATQLPVRGGSIESSLNWSGAVAAPPWPKRIVLAVGGWNAPNVRQPSAPALFTHSNEARSLVWVGIDGHNGRLPMASLPQIGTGHFADGSHFAWWYWWSHSAMGFVQKIDDFTVLPGDEILAGLSVLASEDVQYFIKNQRTGEFRSFLGRRQPVGPIEPLGSSIEWIVERPTDPDSLKVHPLPDYDPIEFKYCMALAADRPNVPGRLVTLAQNGRMIKMREAFADPYRTVYVSRAQRRHDPDGSIGVTCTFQEPT